MSYIDVLNLKKKEIIRVVERSASGKRIYRDFKADHHFYMDDNNGSHTTIFGNKVKKFTPSSFKEKCMLLQQCTRKTWESDIDPVMRCLENHYKGHDAPKANIAYVDIETSFHPERGYSEPCDAFNPITSIAVYLAWQDQMVCLAVPPPGMDFEEAERIGVEVGNVVICKTENEMLDIFLDMIDDADVISGWNSDMYDIPYIINRIIILMGKSETRRMCLWNEFPQEKKILLGTKEVQKYLLKGRIHVDYMDLFKKYTYEELQSYSLNSVAEAILGEEKVAYEGTLDQLYKQDFKKFLQYNMQDTMLIHRLECKLKYIELLTNIAHTNCVLMSHAMQSVAMIDQAIVLEAHERGMVVPDKRKAENARAAGGRVAKIQPGLHKWVGSSDLNSLYPSVIRCLNMSLETVVGQVNLNKTNREIDEFFSLSPKNTPTVWWNERLYPVEMEAWFHPNNSDKIRLDMEDGNSYDVTGIELRNLVFNKDNNWHISANGTIFSRDKVGVVPSLLTRWYRERKELQGIAKVFATLHFNEKEDFFVSLDEQWFNDTDVDTTVRRADETNFIECFKKKELLALVKDGDRVAIVNYMNRHGLTVKKGRVCAIDTSTINSIVEFWDKQQLVRKILLNSCYGALLNAGSRFFDQRIGQSTTLTGRNISVHMSAKTNELITGEYDEYGETVIAGDTDSVYFSAYKTLLPQIQSGEIDWTPEFAISLYDEISNVVSDTFPDYLLDTFNIPKESSEGVIVSGREIVASAGLYVAKKRYAALMVDKEGQRMDVDGKPGKLKIVGLDIRRSDTPNIVKSFLKEILMDTLTTSDEQEVIKKIVDFRKEFMNKKPWEVGSPTAVKDISKYENLLLKDKAIKAQGKVPGKKTTVPGHVSAALAWNTLKEVYKDKHCPKIVNTQKVITCYLKETSDNMFSSIAYPIDIAHLPEWFIELPFDMEKMAETNLMKKIDNLLGVLKWNLAEATEEKQQINKFFKFKKK